MKTNKKHMKNLLNCQEMMSNRKLNRLLNHQISDKPTGIDLLKQSNASILQQINFIGKLEEDICY